MRRAIDNNLEIAVERLNPQTFDFTLAALRADYNPVATSTLRPARQRAAADEPAESRQPERLDDDLQRRHRAEPGVGRRQHGVDLQQRARSSHRMTARILQSAVQQLVPVQLHAAAAARLPDRPDAAADADDAHQPRQRRAEPQGAHDQHAGGRAQRVLGLRVFHSGGRRGATVADARIEAAVRQQDSRRGRHDGADGRRAGGSRGGDAPADADERRRRPCAPPSSR